MSVAALGIALGVVSIAAAMLVGMDRDRSSGPVALIAIAAFYIVFAIDAGSGRLPQGLIALVFIVAALVSYRTSLWIAVVGLIAHGAYDMSAHLVEAAAPLWWPQFCLSFDLVLAAALSYWLISGRVSSMAQDPTYHK